MHFAKSHRPARNPSTRGTALVLAILVAVVLSAFVLLMAWGEGLENLAASRSVSTDEAFLVAESGAQRALWFWKHNNYAWNSIGTWTMTCYASSTGRPAETWTQKYACTPCSGGSFPSGSYQITCTASNPSATSAFQCSFIAEPPTSSTTTLLLGGLSGNINSSAVVTIHGDYATAGPLNSANSLTVTGNCTVGGDMNCGPRVGGNLYVRGNAYGSSPATVGGNMNVTGDMTNAATIGGNLAVNGALYSHPAVTGKTTNPASITVSVPAPPDVASMVNTLKAQATAAGTIQGGSARITTFDFTKTNNNILYVNGDANIDPSVQVIGSGTIVVTGNWNQSGSTFPASGTATVNLVVSGDLNIKNINVNGSLYAGGQWDQSGAFNISGVVAITGNSNIHSSGTISCATPPSFDPRGGGSATISLVNFTAQ